MSMKKKLGSKLSEGVRQVKSQREPAPAVAPVKSAPGAKPVPESAATKPTAAGAVSATPRAATQAKTKLIKLRVWPD